MKANKKDKFKDLIKQDGKDPLPADFTASVMNAIEAEDARELALKKVLQRHPAEGPSFDFAANVMAQINIKPARAVYKPIISKNVWYGVAATIAVFFMLMILFRTSGAPADVQPGRVSFFIQYISAIPIAYIMAFAMIVVLLLADLFISRRGDKPSLAN